MLNGVFSIKIAKKLLKEGFTVKGIDQVNRGYEYNLIHVDGNLFAVSNIGEHILNANEFREVIINEDINWIIDYPSL